MRPTMLTRTTLAVMVAIAVVGAFAAGRTDAWDQALIFGAVAIMAAYLLLRTTAARPLVPVRADLVRWLGHRSARTGERPQDLADRAIAAYRAGLVGEDPDGGHPEH